MNEKCSTCNDARFVPAAFVGKVTLCPACVVDVDLPASDGLPVFSRPTKVNERPRKLPKVTSDKPDKEKP